jgi:hypothetical protein
MEGKTVSGVGVRGELWLGAKQGLECFGECKPLERFFNAKVTGGAFNNVEEEKLFLTNVVIAGIRNDLRAEFHFDLDQCKIDQVDNDNDGWFGEDPWNGNFDLISNITTVGLKAGDASVTGVFVWRNNGSWSFEPGISEFITTFDPPGLTVTSDIVFCTNPVYCRAALGGGPDIPPVIEHDLSFSGTVGPVSVAAKIVFDGGLLGDFAELDVDMGFAFEPVSITFSAVILTNVVGGIAFSMNTKF